MPEPRNLSGRRPYRLRHRLEGVAETRRRITEAAFDLHATIGPGNTTISAIAERAGVQRHTVYHHFPDLDALYLACTIHGMERSQMPDPEPWRTTSDPIERLERALTELTAYHRTNATMLTNVLGGVDPTAPPSVAPDPFAVRMRAITTTLVEPFRASGAAHRRLAAVVAHAVAFETWRSLAGGASGGDGLTDAEIRGVLQAMVVGVAPPTVTPAARQAGD